MIGLKRCIEIILVYKGYSVQKIIGYGQVASKADVQIILQYLRNMVDISSGQNRIMELRLKRLWEHRGKQLLRMQLRNIRIILFSCIKIHLLVKAMMHRRVVI